MDSWMEMEGLHYWLVALRDAVRCGCALGAFIAVSFSWWWCCSGARVLGVFQGVCSSDLEESE